MRSSTLPSRGILCAVVFFVATLLPCNVANPSAGTVHVVCTDSLSDALLLNRNISVSAPGTHVVIHGRCLLNDTVVLLGDRTYTGTSRTGTLLRQANQSHLQALVASDTWVLNQAWTGSPIRIAHLSLDGNAAENANTSGLVLRSWMSVVEDVHVANMAADGIRISNVASDGVTKLTTSQVNGVIQNVFVERSGQHGIHVKDAGNAVTDWSLLNSWISTSGASAVYLENGAGWQVRNNHLYGVGDHAVHLHFAFGSSIADNYIEDFGANGVNGSAPTTGETSFAGIQCVMQDSAASVISGNKVLQLRGARGTAETLPYRFVEVSFGRSESFAEASVFGNVIRGGRTSSGAAANATGLAYVIPGSTANHSCCDLRVMSSANHVQSVGAATVVDRGVTLVAGV